MRVLMTGFNGTVGTAVGEALRRRGDEGVGWDRGQALPGDEAAARALIDRVRPDAVMHLAVASVGTGVADEGRLVAERWTGVLAREAAARGIRFLYSSTAMVFTNEARGPFTVESVPDAREGYGADKLAGERAAREANADAIIARLGWQIGDAAGSNNVVDFLEKRMREDGVVRASRLWKPAMSFLEDTAAALLWLLDQSGDVYLVDGNRAGHSFYDIARALSAERHGGRFAVEADDSFVYDQRMIDERVPVVQLGERLGSLGHL